MAAHIYSVIFGCVATHGGLDGVLSILYHVVVHIPAVAVTHKYCSIHSPADDWQYTRGSRCVCHTNGNFINFFKLAKTVRVFPSAMENCEKI